MRYLIAVIFIIFFMHLANAQNAADIRMTGINNDTLSLSELKGSLVLIEFWASWNNFSRENHFKLLSIYNRYKYSNFTNAKSFEIFSISLDSKKSDWENACQQDNINWKYNVCDFNYWNTQAVNDYNINRLPYYILIDEEGRIIKTMKKIDELEQLLNKYIK